MWSFPALNFFPYKNKVLAERQPGLRTMLVRSHLTVAVLGVCALVVAVISNILFEERIRKIAELHTPSVDASVRVLSGTQHSLAALRGWVQLGDKSFREERMAAWSEEIHPAVIQLEQLAKRWESSEIDSFIEIKKLVEDLEEAQWWVEDSAFTPGNKPAELLLSRNIQPVIDMFLSSITHLLNTESMRQSNPRSTGAIMLQLADIRANFVLSEKTLMQFVTLAQPHQEKAFLDKLSTVTRLIKKTRNISASFNSEQKHSLANLEESIIVYKVLALEAIKLRQSQRWNLARYHMHNNTVPVARHLVEQLNSLVEHQRSSMALEVAEASRAAYASKVLSLLLLLALMLWSILISITSAQRIVRPIHSLSNALHLFATTRKANKIIHDGPREISELITCFNEMRVAVEEGDIRLKDSQDELLHARKLESIGQLAAGIAHEINTPTQYVGDNINFLEDSFLEMGPLLKKAEMLSKQAAQCNETAELAAELQRELENADIEYLVEEIPLAIAQAKEGVSRVSNIVRSMKEFSHPGEKEMVSIDINRAIESTITISSNEWKYVADVKTDFDTELPQIPCLPGEFNQVILNMIVNAAHAIADVIADKPESKGVITVSTHRINDFVEIRISDTGTGIPAEVLDKVFDPFFTTKDVGKGTGQGLSIAQGIVINKHAGELGIESEMGKGTTLIIRLPLENKKLPVK